MDQARFRGNHPQHGSDRLRQHRRRSPQTAEGSGGQRVGEERGCADAVHGSSRRPCRFASSARRPAAACRSGTAAAPTARPPAPARRRTCGRARSRRWPSAPMARWFLLNVSPDVRQQILAFPAPGAAGRAASAGTAIAGCVLTDAELDHTTGLLLLREGPPFCSLLHAAGPALAEPLSSASSRSWPLRRRRLARLAAWTIRLREPAGRIASGLRRAPSRSIGTSRASSRRTPQPRPDRSSALSVQDTEHGRQAGLRPLRRLARRAAAERWPRRPMPCLLDGTFWSDDEPIRFGIGSRTARQMGHVPVSGRDGSLTGWPSLPARAPRLRPHQQHQSHAERSGPGAPAGHERVGGVRVGSRRRRCSICRAGDAR